MDVNLWYDHDKLWRGKHFWFQCSMWMRSLQAIQKCVNCLNWTFQTKVMANRTWTNHIQAICMDVNLWYDHDKFWGGKNFWFRCSMWMRSLQAILKCLNCLNWTFQTKVMANRTWTNHSQAIYKDVNLCYDHDKFWRGKHFWFQCSMWMRSLQAMEKCLNCFNWTFQTKVVANWTWTNHRQAICMDVNLWYDYDKFWRGKLFWLKCSMWMRSLQATKKAWIVRIVPSKQRLWLIELEQITAKPFAWMLIYDMITTNFDEENSFDFSVPCEWGHYKLYRNAWIVWIGPSKPRLWLIELEQITAKPFAWMLIYDMITTNFDEENTFDFSLPSEWGHYMQKGLNC